MNPEGTDGTGYQISYKRIILWQGGKRKCGEGFVEREKGCGSEGEGGTMQENNAHYYFRSKSGTVQLCTRNHQQHDGHYRDHTSIGAYCMSTEL